MSKRKRRARHNLVAEIEKALDHLATPMFGWYRLVGQTPVPCKSFGESVAIWAADRRVRLTHIGPFEVSTVFVGLDHNWVDDGPPLVFETMTFLREDGSKLGEDASIDLGGRWATWSEAEAGHQRAVDYLRANYCAEGEEPVEITGEEASTEKEYPDEP